MGLFCPCLSCGNGGGHGESDKNVSCELFPVHEGLPFFYLQIEFVSSIFSRVSPRCFAFCQARRHASLQKTRRRARGSVTVTVLLHWRHTKVRCTSFGGTFFLCFQYMRSHRPEQNRLRLSLGSVTATGFPQRAQRKLRRTGAPSGPARSSPVSSPCAFFRHRAEQYRWVHRSARKRFPHTGQTASRFTARPRAQGHAKKTAQKKLSFLYGKSALLRARYGLLHTGRNQSCRCYTPPVRKSDGRSSTALFAQRVLQFTVSTSF